MKKNIFLWVSYDFANSIMMIVFLFYFSQWLVIDSGRPDWWYNSTLIISSALFLITAPFLSYRLDNNHKKILGLRITSIIFSVFYILTAIVTLFFSNFVLLATILFTLAFYVYLLSFIYYTPMLNDLSDSTNRGWVSGLGQGMNYFGQVFGLLVSLPFATGAIYLFGTPGRVQTLLPSIIIFIICALPLLIFYREPTNTTVSKYKNDFSEIVRVFKKIISIRNLSFIFLAYFLFSDALLTFTNNFPVYLEKVFQVSDSTKSYLIAGILTLSIIGSIIFGKISDKKGTKKTLLFILTIWVILFPLMAFASSFKMVVIISIIAGIFFGPVWAISRAMVSENTPREIEASSFGIYIIAERFATFIGPIVWSIVLAKTSSMGNISYSYGLISLGILIVIGIFFIKKVNVINSDAGIK